MTHIAVKIEIDLLHSTSPTQHILKFKHLTLWPTPSILAFSFKTPFQTPIRPITHKLTTISLSSPPSCLTPLLAQIKFNLNIQCFANLPTHLLKSDSPFPKPSLVETNSLLASCPLSAAEGSWRIAYHQADCAHFTRKTTNLKGSLKAAWQLYSIFLGHLLPQLCLNTISHLLPLSSNL